MKNFSILPDLMVFIISCHLFVKDFMGISGVFPIPSDVGRGILFLQGPRPLAVEYRIPEIPFPRILGVYWKLSEEIHGNFLCIEIPPEVFWVDSSFFLGSFLLEPFFET